MEDLAIQGIQITPRFSNQIEANLSDYVGVTLTYQGLTSLDKDKLSWVDKNTLVICDEIHHSSEENSWGEALDTLNGRVGCILSLTGTAFRSKSKAGDKIKTVDYVEQNGKTVSKPDFVYTYSEGIRDKTVCPVVFKKVKDDKTVTSVRLLTPDERVRAIATMLSGSPPSESAMKNAKELLQF